jgi:hypothetical protein
MSSYKPVGNIYFNSPLNYAKGRLKFITIFFCLVTLVSFFVFLEQVGGIFYLITNMDNKTNIVKGTALFRNLFFISSVLSVGFYICYVSKSHNSISKKLILIFLIASFFLMLASFGERKNPLLLVLFSIIMWNYSVNKINIFTVRNVLFFLFLIVFSSLAPVLRHEGAFESYLGDPQKLFNDALPYIGELFKRFSDIDISLFIYSYFDTSSKFWYGSTFSGFFTGFIPSSVYEGKPPLDEGVYIYNLAQGLKVTIGSPFKDMIPVGWPLGRVTAGYVHFGLVGIVIYAVLTGMFLKYCYKVMIFSNYSPLWVAFYSYLMLISFGFSNAYVFNALTIFLLLILFSFLLLFFGSKNDTC